MTTEIPGINHKVTIYGAGDDGKDLDFYLTVGIDGEFVTYLSLRITDDRYRSLIVLVDACSRLLQLGDSLAAVCGLLRAHRYEPAGPTSDPAIPMCLSVPDYLGRYLEKRFLTSYTDEKVEA